MATEPVHIPASLAHLSFTDWTASPAGPQLGRCKTCKRVVRLSTTQERRLVAVRHQDGLVAEAACRWPAPVPGAKHWHDGTWTVPCPTAGCPWVITLKRVDGHVSPAVTCGSKCTGAVGPSCDCSCGGANHGAAHSLG